MEGAKPAPARTIDLGPTGMSVTMGHMVPSGQVGQVSFEIGDDVKVGLQFINPDAAAVAAIGKFMR
eukprot:gene22286-28402_t